MNFETKITQTTQTLDDDFQANGAGNRNWIKIIAITAAIIIFAMVYYYFAHGGAAAPSAQSNAKQAPRVTVIAPGRQVIANVISSTGTLAARREMPIGIAGEGGLVSRVWVEAGDWVREGQVLASIERSVQSQESNQLVAGIDVAQADARLAQAELDRARTLVDRGFISKADIDRRVATRDAARARVAVAQAQLGANRARIGRLDIRAPANGLVIARAVEPGQVVSAGSGILFRVARGGEMELRAQLPESDLVRIRVGLTASVTPVGTTSEFKGQIWQISPTIDPESRQGMARIALAYNSALRPGGFAAAEITSGAIDAPLLPESAVQSDEKGNFVYIVAKDNRIERRDVKVGDVNNSGVAILSGLTGQESVVFSAGAFLNPGEKITPQRKKL